MQVSAHQWFASFRSVALIRAGFAEFFVSQFCSHLSPLIRCPVGGRDLSLIVIRKLHRKSLDELNPHRRPHSRVRLRLAVMCLAVKV